MASQSATVARHSSHPQRPSLSSHRSSSSSLSRDHKYASQSPLPTPPSESQRPSQRHHSKHFVVGHPRGLHAHSRVPSYGKNLNKLTKSAVALTDGDAAALSKNHIRSLSHNPFGSPPGHKVKRNGSNVSLARNQSHTSLKKNTSSSSLRRDGSKSDVRKAVRHDAPLRRSHSQPSVANGTALKNGAASESNEHENSWEETEVSKSGGKDRESPTLEAQLRPYPSQKSSTSHQPSRTSLQDQNSRSSNQQKRPPEPQDVPSDDSGSDHQNGSAYYPQLPATPPHTEPITSRLLYRNPPHKAAPQMSIISATATPQTHRSPSSSFEGISTPNVGSREDQISRFIGGSSGSRGPVNSVSPPDDASGEPSAWNLDAQKRNQSTPSLPSQATDHGRSNTPSRSNPNQPSRTQQKLWLQRASSNIEPQHPIPGPSMNVISGLRKSASGLSASTSAFYGDGLHPRVQHEFERIEREYLNVRRYKDPVGDALARLGQIPELQKIRRIPTEPGRNYPGRSDTVMGLSQSLRESGERQSIGSTGKAGARSGLEGDRGTKDDSAVSARERLSSEREREQEGIDQIIRRIWERADGPGGE